MAYLAKPFYILPIYVVIGLSFYEWTIIKGPKYDTETPNGQLYASTVLIQDIDSTTKSLGIWESASFMPYRTLLPNYDEMMARPPTQESYLYAGLGLFDSRGIPLPRAIAAMLGDTSIFYETPLFTLYKTQILGGNVADFLYDSITLVWRTISGYNHFKTEVVLSLIHI